MEAALVECALNNFVSILAEPKMALTQPATVDILTCSRFANASFTFFFAVYKNE